MKKIFLKYNPYKLETEITVDGKSLADNSRLGELIADSRLQDWVEDFPSILIDEYNDRDFEVLFHGTLLDYEDLTGAFTDAYNKGLLTASLTHIPAKETADKEGLIEEVFREITSDSCPFPELQDPQIKAAFNLAMSSDFEVCVVATMSAGKSTLINAMLGKKLMPSKQEACTAIITRIKDEACGDFRAEVYDRDDQQLETHSRLTYDTMNRLNEDENVSTIKAFGEIPFVATDGTTQKKEISLVLIDTPGPNNSRNPDHKKIQSELLGKSSKALVLYIMTGQFGTDDDNTLLARVADSMAVRGKQSKDRFIFVVNKMDDRSNDDGDTEQTLERVRSYLETHGIKKPNLFPVAALPALNIRLMDDKTFDMDEDEIDETETKIKKLNRGKRGLHLETFAPLPPSVRGEINRRLEATRGEWTGRDNENPEEALIHTGIVSVEAAIRQYVLKYAKTAKIKNIVDTFIHRVKELGCEEQAILAISKSDEERKRIAGQIKLVQEKMDSVGEAKRFKAAVDDAVVQVNDESKETVEKIVAKYQDRITGKIDELKKRGAELAVDEVDRVVEELTEFAEKLEPEFEKDLTELMTDRLEKTGNALIKEYKKKIAALGDELESSKMEGFNLDPLQLMGGNISLNLYMRYLTKEKTVEDGEEWIKNTKKKWYKPWTWFQEDGYYRTKYKTVQYVAVDELTQTFFWPIQKTLHENQELAQKYALKQSKNIAERFNEEFNRLDSVLKKKLSDLEILTTDRTKAEERAEQAKRNKAWLDAIQEKVESILEI